MTGEMKLKYRELVGDDPTQEAVERMERIAKVLNISNDDALWGVFLGLETYDKVFEAHPTKLKEALLALHRETPVQGWLWLCIALAGVVLLGSICFLGGIAVGGGQLPPWFTANGFFGGITAVLRVPAGWILLLAVAPWVGRLTYLCVKAHRDRATLAFVSPVRTLDRFLGLPLAIALGFIYLILIAIIILVIL